MYMYFIAIVLPKDLDEKVLEYKNLMFEKYNCKVGLKSPAHITLVPPFWMDEEKQERLIADINSLSDQVKPFLISTSNFASFKPKTIFISTGPNDQLSQVKMATDEFFKNNSFYNIKTETRPFHP